MTKTTYKNSISSNKVVSSVAMTEKLAGGSLVLLAIGFVTAVMLSNLLFDGWKIDLTEDSLFTLSGGTKNVLSSIEEPINLYLFFSDQASGDLQSLRGYAQRVREMLREFEDRSNGKLQLSEFDPVPFSEDEDRAAQYGLQGVSAGIGEDPLYLGLVGTNTIGDEQNIPFFSPSRESFLEYDLAKLISNLGTPERTKIGLLSGINVSGGMDQRTGQASPPWMVVDQARGLFDVQEIDQTATEIEDDISLLWLIHPSGLSEDTMYGIDQYLLAGGKALIFVDPLAEVAPGEPMAQGMPPRPGVSTLEKLFNTWGVEFLINEVVLDPIYALSVSGPGGQPLKHPGIIGATDQAMDSEDIITAELETINVSAAGYLTLNEESSLSMQPLISSSDGGETVESMLYQFSQDPTTLFEQFDGNSSTRVIAARFSGPIKTAFPEGRPTEVEDAQADSQGGDTLGFREMLSESVVDSQMVIVADVDFLSDRMWVQVQSFFGQRIPSAFADNGNFVINALDNLTGSADLISVRSRGTANRPFTLVEGMRVSAEAQYRETEQSLQIELTGLEQRLGELQSNRQEGSDTMSFTPEQQAELDRFLQERGRIRTELRAVRRNLDQDIDRLGSFLKVLNIGFVPLLILMFGVLAHFGKRSARPNV